MPMKRGPGLAIEYRSTSRIRFTFKQRFSGFCMHLQLPSTWKRGWNCLRLKEWSATLSKDRSIDFGLICLFQGSSGKVSTDRVSYPNQIELLTFGRGNMEAAARVPWSRSICWADLPDAFSN